MTRTIGLSNSPVLRSHRLVPLQDFFARPKENAALLFQISKRLLEVLDPVWDAADIWMDRNRHHAGALRTFGIKRLELILGARSKR